MKLQRLVRSLLLTVLIVTVSYSSILSQRTTNNVALQEEQDYVINLIQRDLEWSNIRDSIAINYPDKILEMRAVSNTVNLLEYSKTDSISLLLFELFKQGSKTESIYSEIKAKGKTAIPILSNYISVDYATRIPITIENGVLRKRYFLSLADFSLKLIQDIAGIQFIERYIYNYPQLSYFCEGTRNILRASIDEWYINTNYLTKTDAIKYYQKQHDNSTFHKYKNIINLAVAGDVDAAIILNDSLCIMDHAFSFQKLCSQIIFKISIDLAFQKGKKMELDSFISNGVAGHVSFIVKNSDSSLIFETLAKMIHWMILDKNPYRSKIYIYILNEAALTDNPLIEPILIKFLYIKDVIERLHSNNVNWYERYSNEFNGSFRVCDFALLKLCQMYPERYLPQDWNDRKSMDDEISKILLDYNKS